MRKRIITSLLLITITPIIIFLLPVWVFNVVVSLFICLGLYEFFQLNSKNVIPRSFKYLGIFIGIVIPYIVYYRQRGWIFEESFFIIVVIAFFLMQFTRKDSQNALTLIALSLFGILYIGWFFSFLVKIRFLEEGHKLVAYLLLVTKAGDIGAYLIGSRFGRHRLIPRISPNKSIEGALGGFLSSIVVSLLSWSFLGWMRFSVVFTGGILIGIFAQLGDLAESLVKRDCHVKDSSFFLPGLGGMLDVIDSILFTAPVFYIYLTMNGGG